MVKKSDVSIGEDYGKLVESIPYLLAGLEGITDGHKINGFTVQQTGISGFRVILRATGEHRGDDSVHLVSFTTASDPGTAILLAEEGYREDVIRWSIDRFAKGASASSPSKNGGHGLTIRD